MRKILLLAVCLLTFILTKAQDGPATVTFKPAVFTAEDEVTLTIDVTGTKAIGETELYIWTWCNKAAAGFQEKNGIVNGDWASSSAAAKLTHKGGNIFEYKMVGTAMYGLDPGGLKHFQLLIKTKDGSVKQSKDSEPYKFEPIVFIPTPYRVFPGKANADDVMNLYFHQELAPTVAEQRMTPKTVTVTLYDQNDAAVGQPKTWNLVKQSEKLFTYAFIPAFSWTIPTGTTVKKFTYRFDGTGTGPTGQPVPVNGPVNEKTIDSALK